MLVLWAMGVFLIAWALSDAFLWHTRTDGTKVITALGIAMILGAAVARLGRSHPTDGDEE